jgi:hypothetical protein
MEMHELTEAYLDPAFRYVFSQGPDRVATRAEALAGGLNCIALAHLVLRDLFGVTLPGSLRSVELSSDLIHFEPVASTAEMEPGDLVWFGPSNPATELDAFVPRYDDNGELLNFDEFPINHVAVYIEGRGVNNELMLHASPVDSTNALWALSRFAAYERYDTIYAIMRLRPDFRTDEAGD